MAMGNSYKIAHVVPPYNPVPPVNCAGTELRVYNIAKRSGRFKATVYSGWFPGLAEKEVVDGVCYDRIRIGRIYRRLFQKIVPWDLYSFNDRVGRRIVKLLPGIVHLHNEPKLLRRTWRYVKKCKSILLLHAANEKKMDDSLLKHVDYFIACSRYIASWIQAEYGVDPKRITTIYTGTDTSVIRPVWEAPDVRWAMRSDLGLEEKDVVILFAGRIVEEKGVEELIRAFTIMKEEPDSFRLKLVLAGDIKKSNDPGNNKAVYGSKIQDLVAGRKDIILTDTIPPERMPDFYTIGDVFVLPAVWDDPFPTAMVEAAAAGLPIVATRMGGIPEFIEDKMNGILLDDARNITDLSEKIFVPLKNRSFGSDLGRNARKKVERSFSWEMVATKFEEFYLEILGGHTQSARSGY